MEVKKMRLYEHKSDVTLTTYVLDDSPEMLNGKRRPAVLICPGGAYLNVSDREGEPVAMAFAAMGYHAFVLRYSVAGGDVFGELMKGNPISLNPKNNHPQPIRDIGMAMKIIHEQADQWLVDIDRVALCGFSAGAHNCAMYSVYWNKPVIYEHLETEPELLKPATVILGYGLTDYELMKEHSKDADELGKQLFKLSNTAFLGTDIPEDDLLKAVSPAKLVSKDTPPMFIWATFEDALVPVQHSLVMANALADEGIPFDLHIYEEGGHGLSLATKATATARSNIKKRVASWISMADEWLDKRFAFDLPEKGPWEN